MEIKKIIVANYRYYVSGGPEVYMFKFMEKCKDIGYYPIPFSVNYSLNEKTEYSKYFISSRGGDSVYYNQIKKTPKTILKTLQGAFYNKEAVKKITKLIKDEKPEVLYALQVINTLSPSIFKAAKKQGLKVVHRISDFNLVCPNSLLLKDGETCELCVEGNLKEGINNRCYHGSKSASMIRVRSMMYHRRKKLYDYVDYFVTPTEFTRNMLIKGGFDENKVVTVPTFIDSANIEPNYNNYEYLLFLGRMSHEKGAIYAIKAMNYLKDNPTLKLKITGDYDKAPDDIKQFILDNKLEERIVFTGFVRGEELKNLISNALAVLCPAIWYDNMPNTVLEAYAYGKPVIASNMGCFPELIQNEVTGLLFEPKSSEDLADKIRYILHDNRYLTYGKNGRKLVEEKYNPEQHLLKIKALFEKE